MADTSRLLQEMIDHPEGAETNGRGPGAAQSLAERFDPFHDPYLADPYQQPIRFMQFANDYSQAFKAS